MQLGTVSERDSHLPPANTTSFAIIGRAVACGLLPRVTKLDTGVSHFTFKREARKSVVLVRLAVTCKCFANTGQKLRN
jgi:hypothetical protein